MSASGDESASSTDEPVYVTTAVHEIAQQDATNERAQLSATVGDLGAAISTLAKETKTALANVLATMKATATASTAAATTSPPAALPAPFQTGAAGSGLFGQGAHGIMGLGHGQPFAYPGYAAASGGAAGGGGTADGGFTNGPAAIRGGLMPGAVPAVLGNPQVGFGAWGAAGGPANASQRRCDKAWADNRAAAWIDPAQRAWWVVGGLHQPKISADSLDSVLLDAVDINKTVSHQLINFRDFTPGAFVPRGGAGVPIALTASVRLMAECIVTIARKGVPATPQMAAGARERVDALGRAFHDLLMLLEQHARDHYEAINRPRTRGIVEALLEKDMKAWVRDIQRFGDEMARASFYPPDTLLPAAPLPRFPAFRSYIAVGGLINAAHNHGVAEPTATARGTGAGGGSSRVCKNFARSGSCRFGSKCTFKHVRSSGGSAAAGANGKSGLGGGSSTGSGGGGAAGEGAASGNAASAPPAKKARKAPPGGGGDKGKGKKDDTTGDGDGDE